MYYNDWMFMRIAEERRRDLMRELEHERLVRQVELANHPQRHQVYHGLDWVGRQLVHWGEHLQARHAMTHRQTSNHTMGG
jgi:hypothetical protein